MRSTAEPQERSSEEVRAKIASQRRWSLPQILRNRKEGRMAGMHRARRGQWAAAAKGVCCAVLGVEAWRAGWGQVGLP